MAPKRKRGVSNAAGTQPAVVVADADADKHMTDGSNSGPGDADASTSKSKSSKSDGPAKSHKRRASQPIPTTDAAAGTAVQKAELVSINGNADKARMEQPPKAGMTDPAGGYKTNPPPEDRVVRVYADGVFDLFHLGHMRQLEQAKNAFPRTHLTVGVTGNDETHKRKGLTVLSARERAESLRHCRWVDAVLEDCPWVVTEEFLEEHKFDYVAHDDLPYGAAEGDDIYAPIKESGKFLVTQRTEGVSTTGIITKIIKDYNNYVGRQLKRGTSRQELNVSWLKKNELDLKRHVGEIRDAVRSNWTSTGQELGREINRLIWSDKSRPASPAPSGMRTPAKDSPSSSNLAQQVHAARLEPPKSPLSASPGPSGRGASSNDFATGYTLGLVGGIRSWMSRNRRNVGEIPHENGSGSSASDDEAAKSEEDADAGRGRQGKRVKVQ